jgi:hypothetical protein
MKSWDNPARTRTNGQPLRMGCWWRRWQMGRVQPHWLKWERRWRLAPRWTRFAGGVAEGRKDVPYWRELLNNALAAAKSAVEAEANVRSMPASDLASTLILVAAGPAFVAAIQIGDGAVVAADAEGKYFSITRPAASEYLNETVFLTSTGALPSAQSAVWQGALANLAILSDGLQMAALRMPGGEPHPGFFTPLFQFLAQQSDGTAAQEALTSFLGSPRLRQRTDDDVTLVMATLVSGGSDATAALI